MHVKRIFDLVGSGVFDFGDGVQRTLIARKQKDDNEEGRRDAKGRLMKVETGEFTYFFKSPRGGVQRF
jgi:hypothetical protein